MDRNRDNGQVGVIPCLLHRAYDRIKEKCGGGVRCTSLQKIV